jgi:L-threonylcarbamoyladenylate synthase
MKIIPVAEAQARVAEIAKVLAEGGLACLPLRGTYRIAADVRSVDAVTRLVQSKRRAKHHPALVAVPDLAAARAVVDGTGWTTTRRAAKLWPGPITLVLPPSAELPAKVRSVLTKATGKLGVRVPQDALAGALVRAFGGPVLLSSANHEKKPGASSAAAVRQRFTQTVDIWVDAGDVPPAPPSTIVELTEAGFTILREGAITHAQIERALGAG